MTNDHHRDSAVPVPDLFIDGVPRALSPELRAELPDLTDEIIVAVRRQVPEYARSMDGPYGDALRAGVTQSLKAFVDRVADPSAPTDERDATCRLLGEFEAAEDRPLDHLQAAYRIGCQVAWRRMTKIVLRHQLSASATAALADALFSYADELAQLSADAYHAARSASDPGRRQTRARLARELLARPAPPREVLDKLAEQARWTLPPAVTVAALRLPAGADGPEHAARVARVENVLADLDCPEPFLIVPGALSPAHRSALAAAADGCRVAFGLPVSLDLAPDSLRWARRALDLADAGVLGPGPVIDCAAHLTELWLLADTTLADQVVARQTRIIAQLPVNEQEWLVDTFEPWLERRYTDTEIADMLNVHVQTVRYRIRKLKAVFGSLLDDPDQRLAFELALRVMRMRRDSQGDTRSGTTLAGPE